MVEDIVISVYFMWEWWMKYFHNNNPRPERRSDNELALMYLNRKKFLFESFGSFGIGEEHPFQDGKYVNRVCRWGMDFIPYVLGAELVCQDIGGYFCRKMELDDIRKLKSVNVEESIAWQWIIKRKSEIEKLYGKAENGMFIEGSTNLAVRIRGEEFYIDLLEDKGLATHLLDVITETSISAYKLLGREFNLQELSIANCNVTLISPSLYEEIILPFDIKTAEISEIVTRKKNRVSLHHCDVPVDMFIDVYKRIPGIFKLEASIKSNIKRFCTEMPDVLFSAMVSPPDILNKTKDQIGLEIDLAIKAGAREFDLWNIDPLFGIQDINNLFNIIKKYCERNDCRAVFDIVPFCWDELEWAFPIYQMR